MKIKNINQTNCKIPRSYSTKVKKSPSFGISIWKKLINDDFFIKSSFAPPIKGLKQIKNIYPTKNGSTACKGSIELKDFWSQFLSSDDLTIIKNKGLSTNKDGYPDTFLKSSADKPLSTSYVHNCSALYLFNQKTFTHLLYHAAPDCTKKHLEFIIKNFMHEGFTHGAINPGYNYWYKEHKHNINNMFTLLKKHNPDSIVNLYHSTTPYPEVVGYKGQLFQIPNKEIQTQITKQESFIDNGQASFKILDVGGYEILNQIKNKATTKKEIENIEKLIPLLDSEPEINMIIKNLLNEKKAIITDLEEVTNWDELYETAQYYSTNPLISSKTLIMYSEKLLLEQLKKVENTKDLQDFINLMKKVPLVNQMEKLAEKLESKKHEIYKIK